MELNYTPDNITHLEQDEVFVFGSNLAGNHAGGAARVALERFGAVMGQGVGMQGQSYAIPTMQGGVDTIRPYVDDFLKLASEWDETTFYVTRIGCGIAGFKDEEIAPLFVDALDLYNVRLPKSFVDILTSGKYTESYLPDWQKSYSSYDMAIDYLRVLDMFHHYGPGDMDKALADHACLIGDSASRSHYPMTHAMHVNRPSDSTPGTAENVEKYLSQLEEAISHSRPYDIPCMRCAYSVTAELARLMLELKSRGASTSVSDEAFFPTLIGIVAGSDNQGDNSYIFDDVRTAYPTFAAALKANWHRLFTDGKMDEKKIAAVFSHPDLWTEWTRKAHHGKAVYACISLALQSPSGSADGAYVCDRDGNCVPRADYSLPVFTPAQGRADFPNSTLKKAFIDSVKSA